MATSLMSKVRVAVLGNLHELLDNVADTTVAYKQRIRDLEEALAELRSAGDEAQGTVNGYQRRHTELVGQKAAIQADIDLLLGDDDPSNDGSALQLQMKVGDIGDELLEYADLIQSVTADRQELLSAIEKLEGKHAEMTSNLRRLSLREAGTRAKNRASGAAEAAQAASDAAGSASIDSIADRIGHDNDVAKARFDRVIGGLKDSSSPEEAVRLARANAALEARRAEIGKSAVQDGPAS